MKLVQWLCSLFRTRKKVYLVHIPVDFQLTQKLREALFGELSLPMEDSSHV